MNTLRAIIYTRVSTDEQAENGTSLETQELACLRKAAELGAQVFATYADEGVSGALYQSRGQLQAALSDIEAEQANLLLVYSISRLSRDVEHQQAIKKRVERAGARLIVCDMPIEDTEEGELMYGISGTFAQYERKLIRKRTMNGKRKRAEMGQQPVRTQSPIGYHVVTKEDVLRGEYAPELLGMYQIIPEEAWVVRELFARCARGESLRKLAKWLQGGGIETQRGGKAWYPSTVRYMLSNPVYKGEPVFGRFQWRTDEARAQKGLKAAYSRRGPVEEQIKLSCEPLVEAAVWEACQERLAENQGVLSGPSARKYLLSGLMRCPTCDRSMMARKYKGVLYYTCVQGSPSRSISGQVCTRGSHQANKVEALILRDIRFLAQQPERFASALRTFARKRQQATESPDGAARLGRELAELDAQEAATARAQVDALTKGRSTEVYERLLDDIHRQRQTLQARLAALEPKPPIPEADFTQEGERIAEVMRRVDGVLSAEELTPAEKQAVLSSLIKAIRPENDGYALELRSFSGEAQSALSVQMTSIHCTVNGKPSLLLTNGIFTGSVWEEGQVLE